MSRCPADNKLGDQDTNSGEEESEEEDDDDLSDAIIDGYETDEVETADAAAEAQKASNAVAPASEERRDGSQAERIVSLFLGVVEDHDTHRASVERLKNFFKDASLEQLHIRGIERAPNCQTVLDERNITSCLHRHHPTPLGPAEVYQKLMSKVIVCPLTRGHHKSYTS